MFSHLLTRSSSTRQLSRQSSPACSTAWGCCDTRAFDLVEPQAIGLSLLIEPVQILLQTLPDIQQINTPPQLGVICKFAVGTVNPLIHITNRNIKQD